MTRSLALAIPLKLAAAATAALLAALLAAGPGAHGQTISSPAQPVLTGIADWDGPALPDSAEFEATVLDVTPTGRAPELIGRTRVRPVQERPLRFAIPYDPALIKYGHRYTVEARIVDGGRLRFATAAPVSAFVDGQPVPVSLALPPAGGSAAGYPWPSGGSAAGYPWPSGGSAAGYPRPSGGIATSTLPPPAASTTFTAPPPPAPATGFPPGLPMLYAGTLPCADCAGIEYRLTLETRDRFTLERRYLGKQGEPEFTERGYWTYDPTARKLSLGGEPGQATGFAVLPDDRLRMLDVTGRPIVSEFNYDLVRAGSASPAYAQPSYPAPSYPAQSYPASSYPGPSAAPPPYPRTATSGPVALAPPGTTDARVRRIRGLYRGSTDGASFVECGDSRAVAVATVGQDAVLASAYQRARPQPGEAVLVELDGRIGLGPRPGGGGLGRTLTVDRFVAIRPGESCAQPTAIQPTATLPTATQPFATNRTAPDGRPRLRETTWRLLSVGDQAVAPAAGDNRPFLELNADLPVFSGNSGCNRIGGEYALADQHLFFTPGPSTRMACPATAELERAFLDALTKAAAWNITGDHLTLYGTDGTALLRFTARIPG